MILIGSRGDILGSVASCPGLRVQYWRLRSEKVRRYDDDNANFQNVMCIVSLRQHPGPSSSKRKKGKREETEQITRARTRGLWDGVCEKVMTYCFKMT